MSFDDGGDTTRRNKRQSRPYSYYVLLTPWEQSMCQLLWPLYSVITTCNHMPICKYSLLFQASAWCIIRWNIKESVATTVGLPITEGDANFVVSITLCMFNSMVSLDDIWSYHLQSCVWVVRYLIYWQCYEVWFHPLCHWDSTNEIQTTYIRTDTAYTWQ